MVPGMKAPAVETDVLWDAASQETGFSEEEIKSRQPHAKTAILAVDFQHIAGDPECVLKKEPRIHDERHSALSQAPADGDVNIEGYRLVLRFLHGMPAPKFRDC